MDGIYDAVCPKTLSPVRQLVAQIHAGGSVRLEVQSHRLRQNHRLV